MTKRKKFEVMLIDAGWYVAKPKGPYSRSVTIYEKPGRVYSLNSRHSGRPIRVYLGVRGLLRRGPTRKDSFTIAHRSDEYLREWLRLI